jgi:hypothetical protein
MRDFFLSILPSLIVVSIYLVISTIVSTSFKKIYSIFLIICIIIGLITIAIFIILNNNITIGFAIITGLSIVE